MCVLDEQPRYNHNDAYRLSKKLAPRFTQEDFAKLREINKESDELEKENKRIIKKYNL